MILTRYLFKTLLKAHFFIFIIILGVTFFIGLIQETNNIGINHYNLLSALKYIAGNLPATIYRLSPIILLLGNLIGLSLLINHNELLVMQLAGISRNKLYFAVLKLTLVLFLLYFGIGEGIAPALSQQATTAKSIALSQGKLLSTARGIWINDPLHRQFIFIKKIDDNKNNLAGVTIYQLQKDQFILSSIGYAAQADYINKKHQWILSHFTETDFHEHSVNTNHYQQKPWELSYRPEMLNMLAVQHNYLSLLALYNLMHSQLENSQQALKDQFDFWHRLAKPWLVIIMLLAAVPMLMGNTRTIALSFRFSMALIIGLTIYAVDGFFKPPLILLTISPLLSGLLPVLIFTVILGITNLV